MLLDSHGLVVEDSWRFEKSTADLRGSGDILVSWEFWCKNRGILIRRSIDGTGRTGVSVSVDIPFDEVAADSRSLALIALEFEKFTDGRFFSWANRLRRICEFEGELRAVGDIHRDQLPQLRRVGFNSFSLDNQSRSHVIQLPTNPFSLVYQCAPDGATSVREKRLADKG